MTTTSRHMDAAILVVVFVVPPIVPQTPVMAVARRRWGTRRVETTSFELKYRWCVVAGVEDVFWVANRPERSGVNVANPTPNSTRVPSAF